MCPAINYVFRIVSYHGEPYRNHLERNQSLPTLPTYGNQQFHPIHRSYSLNDNVLRNHNLEYSSQPFRKVAISRLENDYPFLDDGIIRDSKYKLTTRRRTSAQSLSSNSGSSNSFSFQKRQLCPKCANCPTCVVQQSNCISYERKCIYFILFRGGMSLKTKLTDFRIESILH